MKKISKSEFIVMEILWKTAPMAASEIAEKALSENWNIRTLKTLLSRLVQKDVLGTKQDGRRYLYFPLLSQEDYGVHILDDISQKFFKNNVTPLFLHLAKSNDLSSGDIDEITALLETLKPKSGDAS